IRHRKRLMARTDLALYRRLWREARPYWPHLAGMFLLSLLATPIALLVPLPMKIIVDSVLGSHPLPRFIDVLLPLAMHSKNVLMRIYRRRLRGQAHAVKALDSSAQSVVQEVLAGIRVVKAFGQEIREQERFVSHSRAGIRARLQLAFVENGFGLLVGLTTAGGTAAVVSIGAHHVLSGRLTLGELLMVMAYLSQLYEPLKTISRKSASLQSHLASAE